MKEMPMYSPHKKGKLFTRFTHKEDLTLAQGIKIATELNDYNCYTEFKWIFEEVLQEGTYQPLLGLIADDGYATIRTNSLSEFKKGDIVYLKWAQKPNGCLFVIANTSVNYIYTPKPIQNYQRLELKKLL